MKKTKCLIAVTILLFLYGCSINNEILQEENHSDQIVEQTKNEESVKNADKVDFTKKENWETAYSFMERIGEPASQISPDYPKWKYGATMYGGKYFDDAETGLTYVFTDNYEEILTGSEICCGILGKIKLFFPDAV